MANLPPRPVFTNLGDGAPAYNSRRQSTSQAGGTGARNSSNPRHYHPYDRPPSTPPQGSPVPPWRRDASRQHRHPGHSGRPGQHQTTHSFTSRPGGARSHPIANINTTPVRQQPVYQSGPVAHAAAPAKPVVPPHTSGSPATVSPAHNITHSGSNNTSPWAAASGRAGRFSDNSSSNLAGSGRGGAAVTTRQASSASPTHHHGSRPLASSGALPLLSRPPRMPWDAEAAAGCAGDPSSPDLTSPTKGDTSSPSSKSQDTSIPPSVTMPTRAGPVDDMNKKTLSQTAVPFSSSMGTEESSARLMSPCRPAAEAGSATDATGQSSSSTTDGTTGPATPWAASADEDTVPATSASAPRASHPLGPPTPAEGASLVDPESATPVLNSPPPSSAPTTDFPVNDRCPVFNPSPEASNAGPKSLPAEAGSGSDGDDAQPSASSPLPFPAAAATTATAPVSLPASADTTLVLTLGPSTRTFLATAAVVSSFGAWNPGHLHQHHPNSAAVCYEAGTQTLTVDLTRLIRPNGGLPCPEPVANQHLDALQSLLVVMHNPTDKKELSVDELWRLGGLKPALGLGKEWMDFLRERMGSFVKDIKNVGGWMNFNGLEEVGEDEAAVIGQSDTMERAVNACLVFGWAEELRVVAARLAYVCSVEVDEGTGERVLVKPGGRRLEVRLYGRELVDAISAAREKVVENVFAAAEKSLSSWFTSLGHYPCANMLCNTTRIEGLITVLRWLGLFPRVNMERSLQELVTLLQFITATETELAAMAIENGWNEDFMRKRFNWPMYIRRRFGGTCTQCDEKTPTSMLFPLEDLLCDLTFEMQDQLLEYIELKSH